MATPDIEELRTQLTARSSDLERTQKRLKRPSTISFAERQSLSNRAGKALNAVRERLTALEGKTEIDEAAGASAQEALDQAGSALEAVEAALPATPQRGGAGTGRGLPGQQRRGVSGLSQQRAPNRSGSE